MKDRDRKYRGHNNLNICVVSFKYVFALVVIHNAVNAVYVFHIAAVGSLLVVGGVATVGVDADINNVDVADNIAPVVFAPCAVAGIDLVHC
ncbi:Hypothetical predicted protein [Octopus vulgaris]|uniref:Transmembrane protein n=1 Tax=Octopus vulgaris TaxID=6645 RepID=A0AA36F121_OCTVU|nr:Hypothetical predicted protein [Octopus vulgaris]